MQLSSADTAAVDHASLPSSIVVHRGEGASESQQQPLWVLRDEQQLVGGA